MVYWLFVVGISGWLDTKYLSPHAFRFFFLGLSFSHLRLSSYRSLMAIAIGTVPNLFLFLVFLSPFPINVKLVC